MVVEKTLTKEKLDTVINSAQDYLFEIQEEKGYWQGDFKSNPTIEAEHLMLTEFLGIQDDEQWDKIVNYLKRKQLEDGSWNIFPGGRGNLSTTIECYFALRLAGRPSDSKELSRAREFIMNRGGIPEARVFTKIWLSLFGIWDWGDVPAMPPELIFFPDWFPINIYEFGSWARGTIVPLLIVLSKRPVHELPEEKKLPELFPGDWEGVVKDEEDDYPLFSWAKLFQIADDALKYYHKLPWQPGREKAIAKCEQWILERQEADGSWGGIQPPWVYSLLALDILGYSLDDPVMEKGIEGLDSFSQEGEDELKLQACVSPVWDTAWGIISLVESGLSEDADSVVSAGNWLLDQEIREKGDWAVDIDEDVEPGGWAFEFANENYPDTDDTAEVVIALSEIDLSENEQEKVEAMDRGLQWLLAMQSSNGGWGAFDVDNDNELLYEIPFADFGAIIDPPTADVTAHVIEMMGRMGFDLSDKPVKRGYEFIREKQNDDGSWFGRWGVNYIYGTGSVLPALKEIGEDMSKPYVRKAVDWIKEHQNEDGGWGETVESYSNPELAGEGESTPSQTAWSLISLIAAGEIDDPVTKKGVEYLLERQTEEGTWEEKNYTGTGFPGDFYIGYVLYRHYFPLIALGRYQRELE
ncbi:squalene--hopene cyclase [Candidatus Bipolaricaulota bacterium]|nr:squalene--hopene cyclase [Candidatus Bipolaricaulota bacterium]